MSEFSVTSWGAIDNLTLSLTVGSDPFAVAVDNVTNDVFVSNTGSGNVSIINASLGAVVASAVVGASPYGVAFDWRNGLVYVANGGSDNVTVLSAATFRSVANIPVGVRPIGIAYDATSDQVFVANWGSANVSIISPSLSKVISTIATGNGSYGLAIDNATDEVYVTNEVSTNISVINATFDNLTASIPVLGPGYDLQGIAYDPSTRVVWAAAGQSDIAGVSPALQQVFAYFGTDPSGVTYDPVAGGVCVTNTANVSFECLAVACTYNSNYWCLSTSPLVFNETGLPVGTKWTVGVNGSGGWMNNTFQTVATPVMTFQGCWGWPFCWGSYQFSVEPILGHVPVPATGWVNQSTAGYPVINVTFTPGPPTFNAWFNSSGLPHGLSWGVDLNGTINKTTADSNEFQVTNGTYPFSVSAPTGWKASPATGYLEVRGRPANQSVLFTPSFTDFPVFVNESGLPDGSAWWASAAGANKSAYAGQLIEFSLSPGMYELNAGATAGWSCFGVPFEVIGGPVNIQVGCESVARGAARFDVTFHETGLTTTGPSVNWSVTLNGSTQPGGVLRTLPTISFEIQNGTYRWNATAPNYNATPSGGNVTVSGSDLNVSITFTYNPPQPVNCSAGCPGAPVGTGPSRQAPTSVVPFWNSLTGVILIVAIAAVAATATASAVWSRLGGRGRAR